MVFKFIFVFHYLTAVQSVVITVSYHFCGKIVKDFNYAAGLSGIIEQALMDGV